MTTEARQMVVGGLRVRVIRKAIKNLHLGVYPPNGRVRVAAPLAMGDDAIRLAVVTRLGWIRRQRVGFAAQPRQSRREMVSGESHYVLGRRYRLNVIVAAGPASVGVRGGGWLDLRVPPGARGADREAMLNAWHRTNLRARLGPLVEKWRAVLGVGPVGYGIRRMKTRWGSCSASAGRIWINLELAKKPVACIEYVVAHELAHVIEPHHNDRFVALLDHHLPHWRAQRELLNHLPLASENWARKGN